MRRSSALGVVLGALGISVIAGLNPGSVDLCCPPRKVSPSSSDGPTPHSSRVIRLDVEGGGCVDPNVAARQALGRLRGVDRLTVEAPPTRVIVEYRPADVTTRALLEAMKSAGCEARLVP